MKRTSVLRTSGLAAAALSMSLGLAACGGSEEPTSSTGDDSSTSESMDESSGEDEMAAGAEAQTYGAACGEVPTSGDGSFEGMASAPVASAASANPLLTTLVKAVTAAELVEPLNSAPELTVFAPANPAFEAIPAKDLNALLKDKEALTGVLTHHVIPQAIAPDQLSGEFETLAGDTVTINGAGEAATIGDEKAAVLCGNVPTANATVYVIDSVLMP
jgi:uncharacterized surface protein with fasciclin (FAS1) repeats